MCYQPTNGHLVQKFSHGIDTDNIPSNALYEGKRVVNGFAIRGD
jgi:hypothetical protein